MITKISIIFWEILLYGYMYENGSMRWLYTLPELWNSHKYFTFILGSLTTVLIEIILIIMIGWFGWLVSKIITSSEIRKDFKKLIKFWV